MSKLTKPIKIIIVDDHPLILQGFKQLLSFYDDIAIVGEGCNGQEALNLIDTTPCDLLLLDINMPILTGIDVVRSLKLSHPKLKIMLLTVENDLTTLKDAIGLNVDGYILKGSNETILIDAIRHVYLGGNFIDQSLTKHIFNIVQNSSEPMPLTSDLPNIFCELSSRELEILFYISEGFTNKEIGAKLFLSEKTIRNTVTSIFKKIDVKDRFQATIVALNHNISEYITL
ncbi:MAG: response regulator [Cellulosilyticaceae bacterium]